MSTRTSTGLALLTLAIVAGAVGDGLLRQMPWGANLGLWCTLLFAGIAWLLPGHRLWPLGCALVFAWGLAWRDSDALSAMDLGIAAVLGAGAAMTRPLRAATVRDHLVGLLLAWLYAAFGTVALAVVDVEWKAIPRDGWLRHALAVGRGLLIALPLVLLFGALFMAADAAYNGLVTKAFNISPEELVGHVALFAVLAWLTGGYLRGLAFGAETATIEADPAPEASETPSRRHFGLGVVEAGVILGLLDLLFASFVAVQFRYFFGGASLVEATQHLTYADYARQGFFELCTVVALCLPMLLIGHWLFRPEKPAHARVFNGLALVMVGLLFVITASALLRMRLYTHEYGLTELRLFTSAFMVWLAAILAWFCLTVLPGRGDRFAFGALVAGMVAAIALQAINPDDLIVRYDLVHPRLDVDYLVTIGSDGVPALLDGWQHLPEAVRPRVAYALMRDFSPKDPPDWRSWNWSRQQARAAVAARQQELSGLSDRYVRQLKASGPTTR